MREMVDRILQEEQSARSRVERAQTQAQGIILKAKEASGILMQDAVDKARDLAESRKIEAKKNYLAQKEKILAEAKESAALSRSSREKDIPEIARKIFSEIITVKV
jgi:vacuolar-type H+-ATPase subunit H